MRHGRGGHSHLSRRLHPVNSRDIAIVQQFSPGVVHGDHQLSETKFAASVGATEVRPATYAEIVEAFGAEPGSLGPLGISLRIVADNALEGRRNMIAGANKNDYHLRNVTPGVHFKPAYADIRQTCTGDACTACGGPLEVHKTIEAGHIFKLGYKYSSSMGLRVQSAAGEEITPIMGSYGIGIERILCCAIEQNNDANGMILPPAIAPYTVVITPINNADAADPGRLTALVGQAGGGQ